MKASKYVDIIGLSVKVTDLLVELICLISSIGILEIASNSPGITNFILNLALKIGSSQQGNALRASVGSN